MVKHIGKIKSFVGIGFAIIPALFLLIAQPLTAAEDKLKVAVLDFRTVGDNDELGNGAAEILRTTLVETGKYKIIERGMLKQVLEEQKLGLGGVVDPKEAASIGKVLGAKLVAVGSVVKLGESYTLNIRFVDVETGEVVSGKKLTAHSREEIPDLCEQMVKLLSAKQSYKIEKTESIIEPKRSYEKSLDSWAFGLVYPGVAIKHISENHAWELKAQSGSDILIAGPRYYHYLSASGLRLFWGLEADFIKFKGKESEGTGFAGGGFVGGEIPFSKQLSLGMDFGPMYINLAEDSYSQSVGGIQYILNFGVYWHFR